jgi:hypothetical protein
MLNFFHNCIKINITIHKIIYFTIYIIYYKDSNISNSLNNIVKFLYILFTIQLFKLKIIIII